MVVILQSNAFPNTATTVVVPITSSYDGFTVPVLKSEHSFLAHNSEIAVPLIQWVSRKSLKSEKRVGALQPHTLARLRAAVTQFLE